METLTLPQVRDFVVVALAILAALVLIGNAIKTLKEWRKPRVDMQTWQAGIDDKLDKDNKRIKALEDGNKVLCRGMLALLSHEINGNSVDKLTKAQEEISDYLIER